MNGATRNFIINDSASAANDLSISAIITSAGGLDKSGAGTLLLSGVNTYTGNTTISAGTLEIGGAGQLGSGTYPAPSPTVVLSTTTAVRIRHSVGLSAAQAILK